MFAMGPGFFRQSGYAPLVLSGTFANASLGVPYSSSLAISGGFAPYSLTGGTGLVSGTLPAGLSLSIVGSTLKLSGTPTGTTGTSSFTASIGSTDGQTATSAQSVVISAGQTVLSTTNKSSDIILSNSNKTAESNSPSGGGTVISATSKTAGLFYLEFVIDGIYSVTPGSGVGFIHGAAPTTNYLGGDTGGLGVGAWFQSDNFGRVFQSGAAFYDTSSRPGVVGYHARAALDASTGKLWLSYFGSNAWLGGGDPALGTSPTTTLATGSPYYFAISPRRGDASNAADRNKISLVDPANWVYALPSGFGVWT